MNGFLLASDLYVEITDQILELLIIPTMIAGLLAGLVLLINLFARKWLTAGQMGLLWALVLIRLALPYGYAPESSYSLTNLFVEFMEESTPAEPPRDAYAPEPWPITDTNATIAADVPPMHQIQFPEPKPPEVSFTETLLDYLISFLEWFLRILPPFWFIGALFILTRMLVTHWRFTRKINRLPVSTDQRLLRLWNTCCQQVRYTGSVPVIVCDEISQPSVMGALHPKLLLPTDLTELGDSQLQLIMFHELAHLKRRDLWVNWFLFGLKLFHWWNPLYWLAATRYSSLREQSRDAMVLRWREQQDHDTNSDPSREFCELLLTLAQRDPGSRWRISLPVSLLGFLKSPFRKRSLANRLKALRSATVKVHPLHTTAVIIVITLCAATGLADVNDSTAQQQQQGGYERQPNWSAELPLSEPVSNTTFEPLYTQKIQVEKVIEKISEERSISQEQARQYLLTHVNYLQEIQNRKYMPFGKPLKQTHAKYDKKIRLVVHAPNSLHEELSRQLRAWEQSGCGQIMFANILLETASDVTAQTDIEWTGLADFHNTTPAPTQLQLDKTNPRPVVQASAAVEEYFPISVAVVNEQQEFKLIQAAQSDEKSQCAFNPKVTLFNGQKASIANQVQRPFVIGIHKVDSGELKPQVKVITEGMTLEIRPVLTADHSAVQVDLLVEQSEISRVKIMETQVSGRKVNYQVPSVEKRLIRVAADLNGKNSLLISLPPTLHSKRYQYLLLKAVILGHSDLLSTPSKTEVP
ncbi:Regulatory protein BlaR1 [Gimesia chilikensis]|uniref:Regulatory protein BlaR1 n=1 Tax=Gimesia chilikensis TaxID=2605989 RepID=A0A517WKN0_9PLAN|nr:M56 family metallopeptidase [Gimesia chilikensis]QDU05811.1 Regulatory protein BlaR1 [Gimesia chilikensis]